jgi:hypothetical protein
LKSALSRPGIPASAAWVDRLRYPTGERPPRGASALCRAAQIHSIDTEAQCARALMSLPKFANHSFSSRASPARESVTVPPEAGQDHVYSVFGCGQSQAIDGKCRIASDVLASIIDAHSGADVTAQTSGQAVRSFYRLLAAIGLIADVGEHGSPPRRDHTPRAIGSSQYDLVVGASRGPCSRRPRW